LIDNTTNPLFSRSCSIFYKKKLVGERERELSLFTCYSFDFVSTFLSLRGEEREKWKVGKSENREEDNNRLLKESKR